ncbi:MAG TPA: hypothetical protein VFJ14_06935 [Nocardioidaceae bacterium]|nr:hypothetical protein [Nocardioidaceae bacterium]
MDKDDDQPVAGAVGDGDDTAEALSPPERHSRLSRNRAMITVIVVVVVAVVVFLVIAAIG